MIGRRIPVPDDGKLPIDAIGPGDYCGPIYGYTHDRPAVFFMVPEARDDGVDPRLRGLRHVVSPPHVFRECPDGSLEIRESIGIKRTDGAFLWHGYLDEGHVWRTV